jgi:HEAT repeat protein
VAVITAFYGIGLQNKLATMEALSEKQRIDKIKEELRGEITALKQDKEKLHEGQKTTSKALEEANAKRRGAENLIAQFSAFTEVFIKSAKIDGAAGEFESEELNQLLSAMAQRVEDHSALVSLLGHLRPEVRTLAALVLAHLDRDKIKALAQRTALAERILTHLLTDDDLRRKRAEITALGRLGRSAVPPLLARLKTEQDEPKLNIVRALGEIGADVDGGVVDTLIPMLSGKDKLLHRQVVWSLGKFGPKAGAAEGPMIGILSGLPAEPARLLAEPDSYYLAKEIVTSLGKVGAKEPASVTSLLRLLEVRGTGGEARLADELRKEVLITLGALGPAAKAAAPAIRRAIEKERKSALLEEAAIALGRVGDADEVRKLVEGKSPRLVRAGMLALSMTSAEAVRKQILTESLAKTETVLTPATFAALERRGKDAVPLLADALAVVKRPSLKQQIIRALVAIGKDSEAALSALVKALADRDTNVEIAAIDGLERIGRESEAGRSEKVRDALLRLHKNTTSPQIKQITRDAALGLLPATFKTGPGAKLSMKSNQESGKYYEKLTRHFEKGYLYRIDLMSKNFDAFLFVKKGDKVLGYDDDSGGDLNARLFFEPEQTGEYDLWVTTFAPGAVGAYALEIRQLKKE